MEKKKKKEKTPPQTLKIEVYKAYAFTKAAEGSSSTSATRPHPYFLNSPLDGNSSLD